MSALAGIRVVELVDSVAGEYCGKLLSDFGAEVIKVEAPGRGSRTRAMAPIVFEGAEGEGGALFAYLNTNKQSVALDLDAERLHKVIGGADVVIDDGADGWADRYPNVVFCSITPFGQGAVAEFDNAVSLNVFHASGWGCHTPGRPPLGANMRYGDSIVGAAAAYAAVVALLCRELSGTGQFVDVSAVETLSSMIGDCLLEQSLTGRRQGPVGNSHPDMCPHGCYPCSDGSWVSLAVAHDDEWDRLCEVLEASDLAGQPRYATMGERRNHADTLDTELACRTRNHDAEDLARRLRLAGVPASKSATSVEVISDQRLWDRELYRFVTDHREGQRPIVGPSWRLARGPAQIARGAPNLGEDTEYVLHQILGAASQTGART